MDTVQYITLQGCVLPAEGGLLRDHVRPAGRRDDDYLARYDRRTVFYDLVELPSQRRVLATAPRLLNLWEAVKDGMRCDGKNLRPLKRQILSKSELIEWPRAAGQIALALDGRDYPLPVRPSAAPLFDGLNAVVTMNLDNELEWISDWLDYHIRFHGLQGLLLFDNGSTAYSMETLAETLRRVKGLHRALVVETRFPYGPRQSGRDQEVRAQFLQHATLNLARRDFLSRARAVLNVDIDELVTPLESGTIFDLAKHAPLGLVRIRGIWAYPAAGVAVPCGHAAHTRIRSRQDRMPSKWAARPNCILGRFGGWNVHKVGGDLSKLVKFRRDCHFWHCRCVSTGWKGKDERMDLPEGLADDAELARLMADGFAERRR